MRDEGVDWPDPTGGGDVAIELSDAADPAALDAALRKCTAEAFGDADGLMIDGETP